MIKNIKKVFLTRFNAIILAYLGKYSLVHSLSYFFFFYTYVLQNMLTSSFCDLIAFSIHGDHWFTVQSNFRDFMFN